MTVTVKCKNCVIFNMRQRVERQLDHENVELTLSRLSWLFKSWLLFYIERIVFLMKTIVFNSIQVINYWFTLHRTLRFLYQQAQISSPNIWGISDQNITFTSKFWEMLTAELKINHKMLTAYHSQTDEQSKQMNQTVEMYLRHYVNRNQNNWVQLLSTAQFAYNNTQNEITEETPFWANYEYNSKVWQELRAHRSQSQKTILNIAEIKKLHKDLTSRIQQQKKWMTEIKPFVIEEKVYLRTDNIHIKQRSKKLNNKSIKLFKIKRNIKRLSYKLNLLKEMQIHSVFHVFMLQCCNQFISLQIIETFVELNEEY